MDHMREEISKISVISFKKRRNGFCFKVKLRLPSEVQAFQIKNVFLRMRDRFEEISLNFDVLKTNRKEAKFRVALNLDEMKLAPIYWDMYVKIEADSNIFCLPIKNPGFWVLLKMSSRLYSVIKDNQIFYPYIATQKAISFCARTIHPYDSKRLIAVELFTMLFYFIFRKHLEKRKIWLIHEKFCETAQDNAFFFFQYCCQRDDKPDVYYVIKKASKDSKYVEPFKSKVITFMSVRHILYMLSCEWVISSEAKTHGYIWRENRGLVRRIFNKKKQVFLQHGVIGLKRIESLFHAGSANGIRLFVVSSEFEKNLVEKYLGYNRNEIAVTGLARWDYRPDAVRRSDQRQILFFFTWRNWLDEVDKTSFVNSLYYKEIMDLLASEELKSLLDNYKVKARFCLHPRVQGFLEELKIYDEGIEVCSYEDVRIIDLIHGSDLLVTDYSSVAWDMFYFKKPVVFYQFDLDDFMRNQGSYIEPVNGLFGDRASDINDLKQLIDFYIKADFREKPRYSNLRTKYFSYSDSNNCERIYNAIKQISQ